MKKYYYSLFAAATMLLATTSCSQDEEIIQQSGEMTTFKVELDGASKSRTTGDGQTVNTLYYAVYNYKDDVEKEVIYPKDKKFLTTEVKDGKATVSLPLMKSEQYDIVFWAQNDEAQAYTFTELNNITVNYTGMSSNMESRDAFFNALDNYTADGNTKTIELRRPFAQLNVATSKADWEEATRLYQANGGTGDPVKSSAVTISNLATTFNALTGEASGSTENDITELEEGVTFSIAELLKENDVVESIKVIRDGEEEEYKLLAMNYLLMESGKGPQGVESHQPATGNESQATVEVSFTLWKDADTEIVTAKVPAAPIQRNYRTNILGNFLTGDATQFNIVVDAEFDNDHNVEAGISFQNEQKTAHIYTAEGLAYFAELVNGTKSRAASGETFEGWTINLANDIDLENKQWTSIGNSDKILFKGTFDGKGHTIKNLQIVENEAKEGKAYIGFFGYAQNATIKNLTFENVNINIPCLDIDHSQGHIGAVAGSLEGTSTIENVTVKGDIKVYATQNANGASRVAVVAGGNIDGKVTMKNVHVIANEGSSLIANNNTGALAGQLQGECHFEDCSSNIDVTVNKFFAGGIIGLTAGKSTFINCHTTGDIAVLAGREGRNNDQYRVGGIAGGWADGKDKVCTLTNCSYAGNVSGKNSDGSVAEPLDYAGYVGRGFGLTNCGGSKVTIDNISYIQAGDSKEFFGVYDIEYAVSNAEEFNVAMEAEADIITLKNDVALADNYCIAVGKDEKFTINLGGHTLSANNTTTGTHNFFMDAKGGTLNLSNGTVEYTHTGTNMGWGGATTVIDVTAGGVLNLDGVKVINKGGTDMNFAVHMNNWGEATVVADNSSFEAPYCGFRVFNSGPDKNNVTISNSTFTGNNRAFWVHNYDSKDFGDKLYSGSKDGYDIEKVKARLNFNIIGKNNTFTLASETAISPICYGFNKSTYINPETGEELNVVKDADSLPTVTDSQGNEKKDTDFTEDVVLGSNLTVSAGDTNASSGYGATGISVDNGAVLDGNGKTLTVNGANSRWDCAINPKNGTIKNLTINGAFRGIFMSGANGDVYVDNVVIDKVCYTFNSDAGNKEYGVYFSNSTILGWTSHSDVHKEVVYTNCKFGMGTGGYKYAFCRPYGPTVYKNCEFSTDMEFDTTCSSNITFENCTYGGVKITAENAATLKTGEKTFFYNGVNGVTIK